MDTEICPKVNGLGIQFKFYGLVVSHDYEAVKGNSPTSLGSNHDQSIIWAEPECSEMKRKIDRKWRGIKVMFSSTREGCIEI